MLPVLTKAALQTSDSVLSFVRSLLDVADQLQGHVPLEAMPDVAFQLADRGETVLSALRGRTVFSDKAD